MFEHNPSRSRWARTDRLALSGSGIEAETSYREVILASRVEAGRRSYDAARAGWANGLSLEPDDGVVLGELRSGPSKLSDVVVELAVCGKTRDEVVEAFHRLVDAGLVVVEPRS